MHYFYNNDRKRGSYFSDKWVTWSGIICFCLLILSIILIISAKPPVITLFDIIYKIKLRKTWNFILLNYAFVIIVIQFYLASLSLLINTFQYEIQNHKFNPLLIISITYSFLSILIFAYFLYL